MYVRGGTITHGGYCGGEWNERLTQIEAQGETLLELDNEVHRLTEAHSSAGSKIDFGYTDNTKSVKWDEEVFEKNPVKVRSEIEKIVIDISRKHTITTQKDSSLPGDKKWIAASGQISGYGRTQQEAIQWVVRKIKGTHIGQL